MPDLFAEHEHRDRLQARRAGRAMKTFRALPWYKRLRHWAVTSW